MDSIGPPDAREAWARQDWREALRRTADAHDVQSLALRALVEASCGMRTDATRSAEAAVASARTPTERELALIVLALALVAYDWRRAEGLLDALAGATAAPTSLACLRARVALHHERLDDALHHAGEMERLAAEQGDHATVVDAWLIRIEAWKHQDSLQEALTLAERAAQVSEARPAQWCAVETVRLQLMKLLDLQRDDVEEHLALLAASERHAPPLRQAKIVSSLATSLCFLERFDEAAAYAHRATTEARQLPWAPVASFVLAEAWVHLQQGRTDAIRALTEQLLALDGLSSGHRLLAELMALLAPGDDTAPAATWWNLARQALATADHPDHVQATLWMLADRLARAGRLDEAVRALELVLRGPYRNPFIEPRARRLLRQLARQHPPIPVGDHLLTRRLGRGAMGEVWAAGDLAIKWVATDQARAGSEELFRREVDAVAGLAHVHVVPIHDAGTLGAAAAELTGMPEGTPWLAMPLADHSLLDMMHDLTWPRTREVLLGLLDGLAAAHARGLLHLDVKPENVLIKAPHLWLADFGIAAAVGTSRHGAGTPPYMAPERFAGGALGPEADLYAIGCMAWEMVTGRPPFQGDVDAQRRQHVQSPLPPLRPRFGIPEGLVDWLSWLLAKHPGDRPPSCGAAADALRLLGPPIATARETAVAAEPLTTLAFDEPAPPPPTLLPDPEMASSTQVVPRPDPAPPQAPPRPRQPVAPEHPPLRSWRDVRAGDVRLALTGPGLLHARQLAAVGQEPLQDALWARLETVHQTRQGHHVHLVGTEGSEASLRTWLLETAQRAGHVGVTESPRLVGRFPTTLVATPPGAPTEDRERARALVEHHAVLWVTAGPPRSQGDILEVPARTAGVLAQQLQGMMRLDPRLALDVAEHAGGSAERAQQLLRAAAHDLLPGLAGHRLRAASDLLQPPSPRVLSPAELPAVRIRARQQALLDAPRAVVGTLGSLRASIEAHVLPADHPERVAVEVLEALAAQPTADDLRRLLPRVDAHGDAHDRSWVRARLGRRIVGEAPEEALALREDAARIGAGTVPGLQARQHLAVKSGDPEAMQSASEAWRQAGWPAQAAFLDGIRHAMGRDPVRSRAAMERVLQARPPDSLAVNAHTYLAVYAQQDGDGARARRHFEAILRLSGDDGQHTVALLGLAEEALAEGHIQVAAHTARALRHRPMLASARLSVELLCLLEDPVDATVIGELQAQTRPDRGYVTLAEQVREARARHGMDVACLAPALRSVREAWEAQRR